MSSCINENISLGFIENQLKKRDKINIAYTEMISIGASERTLDSISNKLLKQINSYPFFILVNYQFELRHNYIVHHAGVFVVTEEDEDSDYKIGFFESNGCLSEIEKTERHYKNILYLQERLKINLGINKRAKVYSEELMKNYNPINTIDGNCDALSLWFIHINNNAKDMKDIENNLEKYIEDMRHSNRAKKTDEIINNIIRMSKKILK